MTDTQRENKSIRTTTYKHHRHTRAHMLHVYARTHTQRHVLLFFSHFQVPHYSDDGSVLTEPKHVTYWLICLYAYVYRCYDVRWWTDFY